MSSVYSKRLVSVSNTPNSASFYVPAGKVWIIKCVCWSERSSPAPAHFAYLTVAGLVIDSDVGTSGPYGGIAFHNCFVVANAGEEVRYNGISGAWDMSLHGYELTA